LPTTFCRVNSLRATRQEVIEGIKEALSEWESPQHLNEDNNDDNDNNNRQCPTLLVDPHPEWDDVVTVKVARNPMSSSLSNERIPRNDDQDVLFRNWAKREEKGWPLSHRAIVCDRFCGEAVLRGSDIFVGGIMAADSGIKAKEEVAVYAHLSLKGDPPVPRGMLIKNYGGNCIFLGVGISLCDRIDFFRRQQGVGIQMSKWADGRAGPVLPPFNNILQGKMMLQNMPSVLVGHALQPREGEVILDMCCAPGGKTSHVASLVQNRAIIVGCDKSTKKMISAKALFEMAGASCIVPAALDTTQCVLDDPEHKTVEEILSQASSKDGIRSPKGFSPASFDRIILDPPCSALGLRPKLKVDLKNDTELIKQAQYQKAFIRQAVELLKPGGTLVYSTCTFHGLENEGNVQYILEKYPCMKLVPLNFSLGRDGLDGYGLKPEEQTMVRRFEPHFGREDDTMGFFIARFRKEQ